MNSNIRMPALSALTAGLVVASGSVFAQIDVSDATDALGDAAIAVGAIGLAMVAAAAAGIAFRWVVAYLVK